MLGRYKNEINTMRQIETKTQHRHVYRLAFACITLACLLAFANAVFAAAEPDDSQEAYIDSVYSWGIWELGLEPASGPDAPANTAVNDRSRRLQFRPNDNAAYIPPSIPVGSTVTPPPVPVPTPTPVVSIGGTGPILPGMVPIAPNLR